MKDLSKHFQSETKTVLIENFSAKIKLPHFLPSIFFLFIMSLPRNSILCYAPSFLVCWKNLDQFLRRQSFLNHLTMTVKIWKFLS